jgi:hypothetical protein
VHFVKLSFALFSIGGASYALIKADQAAGWVKFASILMAVAALTLALPELPRAIDGVVASGVKIQHLVSSQFRNATLLNSTPVNSAPLNSAPLNSASPSSTPPNSAPLNALPQAIQARSLLDDPASAPSVGGGLLDGIGAATGKAAKSP